MRTVKGKVFARDLARRRQRWAHPTRSVRRRRLSGWAVLALFCSPELPPRFWGNHTLSALNIRDYGPEKPLQVGTLTSLDTLGDHGKWEKHQGCVLPPKRRITTVLIFNHDPL